MVWPLTINKKGTELLLDSNTCQLGGKEGEFTASLLHNFLFRPSISVEFKSRKQTAKADDPMYEEQNRRVKQQKTHHFPQASNVHQEVCKMCSQFAITVCGGDCALAPEQDNAMNISVYLPN